MNEVFTSFQLKLYLFYLVAELNFPNKTECGEVCSKFELVQRAANVLTWRVVVGVG